MAKVKSYLAAFDACRQVFEPQGLNVLTGVELGNPQEFPQETARLVSENELNPVPASAAG